MEFSAEYIRVGLSELGLRRGLQPSLWIWPCAHTFLRLSQLWDSAFHCTFSLDLVRAPLLYISRSMGKLSGWILLKKPLNVCMLSNIEFRKSIRGIGSARGTSSWPSTDMPESHGYTLLSDDDIDGFSTSTPELVSKYIIPLYDRTVKRSFSFRSARWKVMHSKCKRMKRTGRNAMSNECPWKGPSCQMFSRTYRDSNLWTCAVETKRWNILRPSSL